MEYKYLRIFVLLCCIVPNLQGAHILFLHQYATYSHVIVSWPVATALQKAGHKVSYVSSTPFPNEIDNPSRYNISYFVPPRLGNALGVQLQKDFGLGYRLSGGWHGGNSIPLFLISPRSNHIMCEALLSDTDFQSWMDETTSLPENKVDLVILETNLDCGLGVAWALKAKVIVLNVFPPFMEALDGLGGASVASELVSNILIPYSNPLSLAQRVKTTFAYLINHLASQWYSWPRIETSLRQHLGKYRDEEVPTIDNFIKNISLVLSNGHFLENNRRPLPPNFVAVPGLHVKEVHSKLDEDLERFISKGELGFIYISLGTVVVLDELPEEIKQIFFNTIKKFRNVQFLWKWDKTQKRPADNDLPPNLLLGNWFNQQNVLGHPKILGFVTQGGRPSTQEALFNAVPMVTIPVLGDQDYNSLMLKDLGVSVNLEIYGLKADDLMEAFGILINQQLKPRSLEISKILKDTPVKPVEKAVWWISYVLRHNDTSHLQSFSVGWSWASKWLVDVWLTVFGTVGLLFAVLVMLLKIVLAKLVDGKRQVRNKIKYN